MRLKINISIFLTFKLIIIEFNIEIMLTKKEGIFQYVNNS
jgi:hypothetical protein